jgi:predicted ArsR family transcriptional regulator
MSNTREKILQTLLSHPGSTISDLAIAADINTISVRHHLTSLQAEGLITAEEERHGVGRPRLVYALTEKGVEKFPTRYLRLTNRLLDQLKFSMTDQQINDLFQRMADDMASDYANQTKTMSMEERLDFVKRLMSEEGFAMEWEKKGDHYHINEITCPYFHVGQAHPEICAIDQTLISRILGIPIEKIQSVLSGDNRCIFRIPDITVMDSPK